jgi:hypothetical protein
MVYTLKDRDGETVNKTKANSYDDAVIYFATIKNLQIGILLDLFNVEPES